MNKRTCSDDCDLNHCPKCGRHTLGWLDTFERCSTCELEQEQKFMDEAHEIRQAEIRRMTQDEDLADEMEADAHAAMYEDDPNPYHGTYSEE